MEGANRGPPAAENVPEGFNFSIANSDGLVIQELDNNLAKKNGFADLKDLFDRARRRAVDLNGALDDLLAELDELSSQKSQRGTIRLVDSFR
jgi:hypothetical protein